MPSVYAEGWRQGSIFLADLRLVSARLQEGVVEYSEAPHSKWLVATQDCDLVLAAVQSSEPIVEIRPVYSEVKLPAGNQAPPSSWGIRSRRLRLNEEREFLHADAPRLNVSPSLLMSFVGSRRPPLGTGRILALKTWLGRRYDRPAVPDHLVELARQLAKLARRADKGVGENCHDVLVQLDDSDSPYQAHLFAVVTDAEHRDQARGWCAEIANRLDVGYGVVASIDAGTKDELPLSLVENSHSIDLSDVSWAGEDPAGAF